MDIMKRIEAVKRRPDFDEAGMVLCHNGVVRKADRNGRKVTGLTVTVDHGILAEVLETHRNRPGIIDIQIEIAENRFLKVGDDVMLIVVAGDYRENVIQTLSDVLNAVKSTVTAKTQYYA